MSKENKLREDQIDRLIAKYEKQYEEMIVMDDYDGGRKESLRIVIQELKKPEINNNVWFVMFLC